MRACMQYEYGIYVMYANEKKNKNFLCDEIISIVPKVTMYFSSQNGAKKKP